MASRTVARLCRQERKQHIWPKPVRRLWGIGPKTEQRLLGYGIETIGQLVHLPDDRLHALFGRFGEDIRDLARGIDPRPVIEEWETRSISSEETFEHDVSDIAELDRIVYVQSTELAERLHRKQLRAYTVGIKIKLADRQVCGRQTSFSEPVADAPTIARAASFCLHKTSITQPVRLIGVRVSKLVPYDVRQTSLFGAHAS